MAMNEPAVHFGMAQVCGSGYVDLAQPFLVGGGSVAAPDHVVAQAQADQ
jgi:hypothetical protein